MLGSVVLDTLPAYNRAQLPSFSLSISGARTTVGASRNLTDSAPPMMQTLGHSAAIARTRPTCAAYRNPRHTNYNISKRASVLAIGGVLWASTAQVPAWADLPGFKKDLRSPRSRNKIDPDLFEDGPEGLRLYDVKVGDGPEIGEGDRVVVHYECKWRGITFVTSRQGVGVTGGEPYGFDVGATGTTKALKGLDLGVRGMRVGGLRKLVVPPELGYGERGVGEIPGGATLEMEVEVLSKKLSPFERAGLQKPNAA